MPLYNASVLSICSFSAYMHYLCILYLCTCRSGLVIKLVEFLGQANRLVMCLNCKSVFIYVCVYTYDQEFNFSNIPYSRLFTRGATFADAFNLP